MNDVDKRNDWLANTVSELLRGSLNLVVEPCVDGSVGVIVRPREMKANDA